MARRTWTKYKVCSSNVVIDTYLRPVHQDIMHLTGKPSIFNNSSCRYFTKAQEGANQVSLDRIWFVSSRHLVLCRLE